MIFEFYSMIGAIALYCLSNWNEWNAKLIAVHYQPGMKSPLFCRVLLLLTALNTLLFCALQLTIFYLHVTHLQSNIYSLDAVLCLLFFNQFHYIFLIDLNFHHFSLIRFLVQPHFIMASTLEQKIGEVSLNGHSTSSKRVPFGKELLKHFSFGPNYKNLNNGTHSFPNHIG